MSNWAGLRKRGVRSFWSVWRLRARYPAPKLMPALWFGWATGRPYFIRAPFKFFIPLRKKNYLINSSGVSWTGELVKPRLALFTGFRLWEFLSLLEIITIKAIR